MHYKLCANQEGNSHEEAYVDFEIAKEWHGDMATNQITVQSREQEKRHPTNERDHDHALPQVHHRIVGEPRLTQKLKQWAAQNEREILCVLMDVSAGTGR